MRIKDEYVSQSKRGEGISEGKEYKKQPFSLVAEPIASPLLSLFSRFQHEREQSEE